MNDNTERQKIVLAALLHDIGKFYQRADEKWDKSDQIKKEFPNKNFDQTVPTYDNGNPKYIHALWTQYFFFKFKINEKFNFINEGDNNVATLAARHHLWSGSIDEQIISLADKWSSSIDRPDEGEEGASGYKEIKELWGQNFVNKVPLTSIFDYILKEEDKVIPHLYQIKKIDVWDEKTVFAEKLVINKDSSLQVQYLNHRNNFENEIAELINREVDFEPFLNSLLDIMRNYLWCIPSATNIIPANVNLFEHLKTTAGIALCLYDFIIDKNPNHIGNLQDFIGNDDSLMMVCIDISGIQNFIYDIANKKAAKSLKGRSFFLQLLMNTILEKILNHNDIKAFPTNVIYSSGGKAYVILPNLERTKKALKSIDLEIQEYLWHEFHGKLYVVLGCIGFSYQTLKADDKFTNIIQSNDLKEHEYFRIKKDKNMSLDLGDIWRIASDRASEAKHRKFLSKIKDFSIFEPEKYPKNSEKCAVTGERYPKSELVDIEDDEEKELLVSKQVANQYKLGEALKNGNYLVKYLNSGREVKADIDIMGIKYEIKEQINTLPFSGFEQATIFNLNGKSDDIKIKYKNIGFKTLFYGGNIQPLKEDRKTKSFEDLVKLSENKRTKLGILRMDVDGLGNIFINGFDEKIQKKSFAAYSTLSFMLDLFFSGYINKIQQEKDFKDHVLILYSGGDDLFAIGRWDKMIDFADRVQSNFKRFTGRDDITISGGLAIVDAKYPISKAADLAGEAEDAAKTWNDKKKNAFNFFGETVSWNNEFDFVKNLKGQFYKFEELTGRAILHQIQKYKLIKDKNNKDDKIDLSYKWHSAYSLSRSLERIKKDKYPEAFAFVDELRKNLLHNEEFGADRYLDLAAIAARWAEYYLKLNN